MRNPFGQTMRDRAGWNDLHDEWLRQKRLRMEYAVEYIQYAVWVTQHDSQRPKYDRKKHRSQGKRCRACGVLVVNENISGYCQKCIGRKRAAEMHGMGRGT